MEDLNRDFDKVLVALKKGARLLKYSRKGNPKFYPFRLSGDETSLIWISNGKEKTLKLASVSKIISGQRTAVFQRFPCLEKDHVSFSLIYNNGQHSLDLICKDKVEVGLWFAGIKAAIASGQSHRSKIDGWNEGGISLNDTRDLTSSRLSDNSITSTLDSSPESSLVTSKFSNSSFDKSVILERTDATDMQSKGSSSDVFRASFSSAPSTSSHGSAQDDPENLGDVYVWGEVICDNSTRIGMEKHDFPFVGRVDLLLPRPLESNIIFDVQNVACGVRHGALITRQGEIFTWGEESGGRLGHGVTKDVIQPHLVETLSVTSSNCVACGEFHTCAVTVSGELYTWGDGTHCAGLLGHGSNISHWVPKRVSGPLDGLQVAYVACGTWHTALITTAGQLFTFGDGCFGVLGHGNNDSSLYPREVECLKGLKTIAVACGVWHTAAIIEVIATQSNSSVSSGKLFTWGDGDKYRLGHGDKEPRLEPTCVPSLIEYSFHKIACGHSLTVGLTTSGHVFTMGSSVYGQLGNSFANGKLPCLVGDKLVGENIEEIACGSYHVAVLTSKNEVYTWGKGANGRLGHGDIEDRKTPTIVESLKDRHVKHITCGSNFSAAICHHKWVSGSEQSQCSSCRQAFGFTRKRHNCYNCGLVHCHSCSSKKSLRAALSPNPSKPCRVCDSCYLKLSKALEQSGFNNKKTIFPRLSSESKDKFEQTKIDLKSSKSIGFSNLDLIKQLDTKAAKYGKKTDSLSLMRGSLVPSYFPLKDMAFPSAKDLHRSGSKPSYRLSQSVSNSRAVSPFSRKPSPPRCATPIPISSGLSFSKNVDDNPKNMNEILNQEVQKLRAQVESLRKHCQLQEFELHNTAKKAQEALALATEESARSRAAKEVIKSLTAQLKDMAERLPSGIYDGKDMRPVYVPNGIQPHAIHHLDSDGESMFQNDASNGSNHSHRVTHALLSNGTSNQIHTSSDETTRSADTGSYVRGERLLKSHGENADDKGNVAFQSENSSNTSSSSPTGRYQVEAEWIEQYEPGVYITLAAFRDGTRDLKRVRFSRRRFGEHQAESWWSMNREKVYKKYNVRPSDKAASTLGTQSARRSEEILPSPHPR